MRNFLKINWQKCLSVAKMCLVVSGAIVGMAAYAVQPGIRLNNAEGAAEIQALLGQWKSAMEFCDWSKVRSLWLHDGADSGLNPQAFASIYSRYCTGGSVTLGALAAEGTADSPYYEVPVTLAGTKTTGEFYTIEGKVRVARSNSTDNANDQGRRWYIVATEFTPSGPVSSNP